MSSRTKIRKSVVSNQFISTRKTQHIKKCPISRTNIVNFDTLTLYQNVSYKMVRMTGLARSNLLRRNSESNLLLERHIISISWKEQHNVAKQTEQWKRKRSATALLLFRCENTTHIAQNKNTATKIYLVGIAMHAQR